MTKARWVGLLFGLAATAVAAPSFADGPATAGSLQLGIGFRYGAELNEGDFNPWGTGIGLDGGYTLPFVPIYLGGNLEYFFGSTEETPVSKLDGNIWQLMAEGGYDVGLGDRVVLRPKLGLGYAHSKQESCLTGFGCTSDTSSDFAMAPGVKLMLFLPVLSFSFDGRYEVVFADESAKAFIFSAGLGF